MESAPRHTSATRPQRSTRSRRHRRPTATVVMPPAPSTLVENRHAASRISHALGALCAPQGVPGSAWPDPAGSAFDHAARNR